MSQGSKQSYSSASPTGVWKIAIAELGELLSKKQLVKKVENR